MKYIFTQVEKVCITKNFFYQVLGRLRHMCCLDAGGYLADYFRMSIVPV